MLELTSTKELTLVERQLTTATRVPVCADAAYLLARARFLEAIRTERASARVAS